MAQSVYHIATLTHGPGKACRDRAGKPAVAGKVLRLLIGVVAVVTLAMRLRRAVEAENAMLLRQLGLLKESGVNP